ncbi:mRNA (2 -o-methyladenosine-n6-)-methyltransferase [Blastocystis sp. subtype 4]|uniref:mRNA (2 -o-methyladenosine-n6-)-methyltransferase n=1 Tax=Blastocystis sp. subtype 4 TaxID=944170 RepID=UPI0007122C57|nr:mRNA (2 -o-methyladenosine-n6-)-methyltransferase [Blastocystis sp. subtype 4]KNB45519.1 mRNA (2 -o-methyladenosine-n6-)-methyltransferase [Blastocystis sp. subtype 4]|eukprot:XP_014528962.1 mRNA (2 -o-methyladenosine-n6-)-methyltransferase [Blastocystis sp. subtype 4]
MKELFFDIERSGEYKHVLSLSSYLVAREGNRRSNRFVPKYDEYWMQISRRLLDFEVPVNSVGINADIRTFDWRRFGRVQRELTGHLFDVVMMDPPWHLSSADPCRGVAIKYQQLDDESIASIPIHLIQDDGLLFLWTINAKYTTALRIIQNWGYVLIGDISWVKLSARNFVIQSNGFYLQHAKETCFVAKKGNCNALDKTKIGLVKDVIFSKRKGQSQKPNEIYSIIESLVPNGNASCRKYLEEETIFVMTGSQSEMKFDFHVFYIGLVNLHLLRYLNVCCIYYEWIVSLGGLVY